MNKIIVTYDLCGANKNYDGLIGRLERFPKYLKLNKSSWLIKTRKSSAEVRDELRNYIDSNDMLFVANLTGESAWTNAESSTSEIKKILTEID